MARFLVNFFNIVGQVGSAACVACTREVPLLPVNCHRKAEPILAGTQTDDFVLETSI